MEKTLHLNLHRKWFDMTLAGTKTEDYREITPFWYKRLIDTDCYDSFEDFKQSVVEGDDQYLAETTSILFDTTTLSNGYAKKRPQFVIDNKGLMVGLGNPEWGAPDYQVFIIEHGQILKTENCTQPI